MKFFFVCVCNLKNVIQNQLSGFFFTTCRITYKSISLQTMLDLNLFQVDKGGNPELIRESQRRRGAPVEIVDEVISLYDGWRTGT